ITRTTTNTPTSQFHNTLGRPSINTAKPKKSSSTDSKEIKREHLRNRRKNKKRESSRERL
ncbi:hypothetical protein ACCT11_36255, partial [Rhizobium johnstonii]|uniref:hypothetical protein n=1 Tax=Rhizobium johnstonii TaxID=3019933 RepID=UPI003F97665A